ncbi:MAG: DnaD domain protein [Dehalococcoidales bacterium]|nr:DnaD domain protein [Dehalococcoidales bacterium]
MKEFRGFPSRMEFTSVPNIVFSSLLAQVDDMAELKTTLHVIAALYRKKGSPRYVGYTELLADAAVVESFRGQCEPVEEILRDALRKAAERGTFIHLRQEEGSRTEDIYLLNDEAGRQAAAKVTTGELELGGIKTREALPVITETPPDIFTVYEQNIGMLTPMIADELRDAERQYSPDWIRDAIKESVLHNKRNIKYITRILETWSVEGRSDGTYQRHPEKTDPDRYIKGKYGHIVKR